jgi:hypothetical protein
MAVTEEEFEQASRRGAARQASASAVVRAAYNRRRRELVVEFRNGMRLAVPVAALQDLHDAPRRHWPGSRLPGGAYRCTFPRSTHRCGCRDCSKA